MASSSNHQKKGKGRQKLSMTKIEKEANLQVTFSKRRAGIFKKASEISTLCGAETAMIVFSPGDKVHSFGHPSVEAVASKFLNHNVPPPSTDLNAREKEIIRQQTSELNRVEHQLKMEQRRAKELQRQRVNLNTFNYQQLHQLQENVLNFKNELETKVNGGVSHEVSEPCGQGIVTYDNAGTMFGNNNRNPRSRDFGHTIRYTCVGSSSRDVQN